MAFNPFHGFRKHKRVIFAILTIICMFTFVLAGSFGKGDAFEWFLSKFGGSSKQGEVVTKLYGSKVYRGEIDEQRRLREVANEFAQNVIQAGATRTSGEITEYLKKTNPPDAVNLNLARFRDMIADVLFDALPDDVTAIDADLKMMFSRDSSLKERYDLKRRTRQQRSLFGPALLTHYGAMNRLRADLAAKGYDEEARIVAALRMQADYLYGRTGRLVFGGSTKRQDLLDFKVWLKQADNLGIKLTDENIRTVLGNLAPLGIMVAEEDGKATRSGPPLTGNKANDTKVLRRVFSAKESDVDLKTLYKALRNEIRVSLAQGVILGERPGLFQAEEMVTMLVERSERMGLAFGQRPGMSQGQAGPFKPPLGVTPGEYLDYYRDNRESADFALLAVPASGFLPADLPEPQDKEKELNALFEAYRRKDPDPEKGTPGFRILQRGRVQWVAAQRVSRSVYQNVAQQVPLAGFLAGAQDSREQYYKERAQKQILSLLALSAGSGNPNVFLQAADPVYEEYDSLRRNFELPSLLQGDPGLTYYSAMNQPRLLAGWIAQAAGGPVQLSGLAATLSSGQMRYPEADSAVVYDGKYQEELLKQEAARRARVLAGLAGGSIGPALGRVTPWAWADSTHEPFHLASPKIDIPPPALDRYLPMAALRAPLLERLESRMSAILEQGDLQELEKNISDANGDKEKAQAAIAAGIKKMRLELSTGESTYDGDPFTLSKDPGLRPLWNAFQRQVGSDPKAFANRVFSLPGAYTFSKTSGKPDASATHRLPTGNSVYLFWLTKTEPGKTPAALNEVRTEVLRAWHMSEARKRARQEADRIRDEIAGKSEKEALKTLDTYLAKHPDWGRVIRLYKVSKLREEPTARADFADQYLKWTFSEEDIPYPTDPFVDRLMKLNAQEAGVLKDRPERTFYVAYAVKRYPADGPEVATDDKHRTSLLRKLNEEQKAQRRQAILKELRRQAGTLDARDQFELMPGVKAEESSTSEEGS